MRDIANSLIFILCQCLLLGLVLSPLLLRGKSQARKNQMRSLYYAVPAAILLIAAAVNVFKAEFPGDQRQALSLGSQVLAGKEIIIRFDPETCAVFDLGSIACGSDYHGRYERGRNRWNITGPDRNSGAIDTRASSNGEPVRGSLSLWGMLSKFDEHGTIIYLGQGIGHLRLAPDVRGSNSL